MAIVLGALLAPFVLFSTDLTPWSQGATAAMFLQEITAPIVLGWQNVLGWGERQWNTYVDLHDAAEDNIRLQREIAELRTKTLDYDEQVQQSQRLRRLLNFTERLEDKHIVAEVLSGQRHSVFKTLRLNKGSLHGVKVGMPVVAPQGAVGRILRTGFRVSDVQLLVDFDFNIDALVLRSRIRAVLSGYATENCRLHLQKGTEIRIGDTIVTSGIVGSFPKGIPIGKVVKISYESDNVSQVVTVEPWVDHRRLEEVVILDRLDPEVEMIVGTAGDAWLDKTIDKMSLPASGG